MDAGPILRSVGLLAGLAVPAACGAASSSLPSPPAPVSPSTLQLEPRPALEGTEVIDLGGSWEVWLDPQDVGLHNDWVDALTRGLTPPGGPAQPLSLPVPGALEADASTVDYDGVAFYARTIQAPAEGGAARALLRFEQVDYACQAWLDGRPLGGHEGGYEAFTLDTTAALRAGAAQRLVVRVVDPGARPVDGLTLRTTPNGKQSWYENFGGLLGPVTLQLVRGWSVREGSLRVDVDATPGQERVALSGELLPPRGQGSTQVSVALRLYAGEERKARAGEGGGQLAVAGDLLQFRAEASVAGAARWSPESPATYRAELRVNDVVVAERTVGFRTLSIDGGDFRIDGARRTLKGVLWQPHWTGMGGVTPPAAELAATARSMKATGFDLVRAHVRPAPPAFLDECDRIGLLVLEEPAIGWVDDDPGLLPRLLREVSWMVGRDRHHPSIVLWGVLNELSGRAYPHVGALVDRVAQLDPTRPVLEDSGAFLGQGRVRPPGAAASVPMIDRHAYPPYPLPPEDRDTLLHLSDPNGGLVFVSEFGYGTLLDTEAALEPFTRRAAMTNERIQFASWAAFARRAKQAAAAGGQPPWWQRDWTAEAAQVQADATEDLIEVLRANPAVDLLCYTQWQAVNEESSAGLLEPWGEERPAMEAARRALAPACVELIPNSLSVIGGEPLACTAVAINDSAAPLAVTGAGLSLSSGTDRSSTLTLSAPESLPIGVTRWDATLPGSSTVRLPLRFRLRMETGAGELISRLRWVPFLAPPGSNGTGDLRAWTKGDPPTQGFLRRCDWQTATLEQQPDVALIADFEPLRDALSLEDWLRLWAGVHAGAAAVVLVPGPATTETDRSLGMLRGVRTHTSLPLPVSVASAPGNFMGRVHAVREGEQVRLLGRGDEAFSPEGMLVDPPPDADERMVTIGWLGNRLGDPDVVLRFGRGTIRVIGVPLLRTVGGEVDPSRDERLAQIVSEAAREAQARLGVDAPWTPPSAADLARLQTALDRLDRLVALGDRQSPFSGDEPRLPAPLAAALAARTAALEALFAGDTARGLQLLDDAVAPLWTEAAQRFLDREEAVLAAWSAHVASGDVTSWEGAYAVRQAWVGAVGDWFAGKADAAQAGIDRAWELAQPR